MGKSWKAAARKASTNYVEVRRELALIVDGREALNPGDQEEKRRRRRRGKKVASYSSATDWVPPCLTRWAAQSSVTFVRPSHGDDDDSQILFIDT